jgi:hypothetical protein
LGGTQSPVPLDRSAETFADLDLARFHGVGHFPQRENRDRAAPEIDTFFSRLMVEPLNALGMWVVRNRPAMEAARKAFEARNADPDGAP